MHTLLFGEAGSQPPRLAHKEVMSMSDKLGASERSACPPRQRRAKGDAASIKSEYGC